jgi:hypothetical protein
VAVFQIQEEFFTGDETQEQQRFAEEHYGKSKAALKRAKSKHKKKIGDVLRVADIPERPGSGEGYALGARAGRPIRSGPRQEKRPGCCEQGSGGIQQADEHVSLNVALSERFQGAMA